MRRLSLLLLSVIISASLVSAHAQAARAPITLTAQTVSYQKAKGLAEFTGNVLVKQGGITLATPKLSAKFNGQGAQTLQSLTATGTATAPVRFTRGEETATSRTATYTPDAQQLVLTGNVTLTRQGNTLAGEKLVYDLATGTAMVTGGGAPVRATLTGEGTR
jgi:lipopolysaccharide export system protein LptA